MPRLEWIGKDKIVNHHLSVPFCSLKKMYTYNCDNSDNMVIHGDNLTALKALLPKYEGKIDFIYIDPPYNTGEEHWVYNDNVNDPRILKWLGEVVGKDTEDFSRHDKWLCMMYPRLKLMHKLLAPNGVIFISIDDNEQYNLRCIMNEIFGELNFCANYYWKRTDTPPSLSYKVRKKLEYVMCYQKEDISKRRFAQGLVDGGDAPLLNGGNPIGKLIFKKGTVYFNIPDGVYSDSDDKKIHLLNSVTVKNGVNDNDFEATGQFKWGQAYLDNEIKNGGYLLIKSKLFSIRYQKGEKGIKIPSNIIDSDVGVGTNEDAKKELIELGFKGKISFDYAKPVSLIEYLINMVYYNNDNITVLDAFAGSGTTGQAVFNLNKDGGNRKVIEIEMMDYAETITAARLKKSIDGYGSHIPTNGNFAFYEIGEQMFDESGNINSNLSIEDIRKYVYYTETKCNLDKPNGNPYFLGRNGNTDYYFYYEKNDTTELNYRFLSTIPFKNECTVIYADLCLLSEKELNKYNIVFKKISRDIMKF